MSDHVRSFPINEKGEPLAFGKPVQLCTVCRRFGSGAPGFVKQCPVPNNQDQICRDAIAKQQSTEQDM